MTPRSVNYSVQLFGVIDYKNILIPTSQGRKVDFRHPYPRTSHLYKCIVHKFLIVQPQFVKMIHETFRLLVSLKELKI